VLQLFRHLLRSDEQTGDRSHHASSRGGSAPPPSGSAGPPTPWPSTLFTGLSRLRCLTDGAAGDQGRHAPPRDCRVTSAGRTTRAALADRTLLSGM